MEAMRNGLGLDTVKVSRTDLLKKLEANRETHIAEYTEAHQGFLTTTVKELEGYLKRARKGDIETRISFDRPVSHEQDYNTVIEMLQMSVDEEIYLTTSQFRAYVQDKWDWKQNFLMTNTKYMSR